MPKYRPYSHKSCPLVTRETRREEYRRKSTSFRSDSWHSNRNRRVWTCRNSSLYSMAWYPCELCYVNAGSSVLRRYLWWSELLIPHRIFFLSSEVNKVALKRNIQSTGRYSIYHRNTHTFSRYLNDSKTFGFWFILLTARHFFTFLSCTFLLF